MKKAGAGVSFRYAGAHAFYIKAAKDNRLANNRNPFKAYRVNEIRPQVGDLVCKSRSGSGANYENVRPGHKTHCDIVTEVHPNALITIGGNVKNSVSKTRVSINTDGYINDPRYFAVIRIGALFPLVRREIGPFEIVAKLDRETRSDIELSDEEWEQERGRRIPVRGVRFRSRPVGRRWFPPTRPRWRRGLAIFPPLMIEEEPQGANYIRWVQTSLNRIMGLRLDVHGIMEPQTRSAIRSFQRRQGLPVTGTVGPETEQALVAEGADSPPESQEFQSSAGATSTPASVPWDQQGIEYVKWLQRSLNQVLKLKLPVTGSPGSRTISAIQQLQRRVRDKYARMGLVGPWTDRLLAVGGASAPPVLVPPGAVGLDCNFDTRPYLSCIQKARFRGLPVAFVVRYYSGARTKDLSRSEAEALSKLGIRCVTVWERFAKEATGHANGRTHGYLAFKLAVQCGQPTGTPIYFAVDYEPTMAERPGVERYFEGVRDGLTRAQHDTKLNPNGLRYEIGVYANRVGLDLCKAQGIATWFWQSCSKLTAGGTNQFRWPSVAMHQVECEKPLCPGCGDKRCNVKVDWNESDGREGGWLVAGAAGTGVTARELGVPATSPSAAEFDFEWEVGPAKAKHVEGESSNKWLKLFPDAKRSKADFIIDGESYFQSVIWAIETAKTRYDYIYITGWMLDIDLQLFKNDKNKTLFKLLKDRSERGVEIRILIWDNLIPGYAKLHNDAIARLNQLPNTKAFIDQHTFFPEASKQLIQKIAPYISDAIKQYGHLLLNPAARLEENYNVPGSYVLYRLLTLINQQTIGAHHEKLVIVKGDEGLIAFCGGIDFNKNRVISTVDWPAAGVFKSKTVKKEFWFPYYHDNACRLRGPAAYDVLQKFKKRWSNHPVSNQVGLLGSNETKPKEALAPYPYTRVVGTYNSPNGRDKDRSLQEAYLKIIANAKSYIYIEDQYLVNLDVARVLNKKIKESNFQKLTFAIQDSIETADILIPNRKRGEFLEAVLRDTNDAQKKKVLLAVIDRTKWDKEFYHPGMHAKTLIVDDEIAIIGSANVNRRSFTCDSETSVIVFDNAKKVDRNFARIFRILSWKGFLRKPADKILYESWWNFPTTISDGDKAFSILIKYTRDEQPDLDEKITDSIKKLGVLGPIAAYQLLGKNLTATSAALSPQMVRYIFDTLWEHFVDPVCR